jgi:16S rRNA (adenine1518-N6/adenine1519-N6)-dimethyltransferase
MSASRTVKRSSPRRKARLGQNFLVDRSASLRIVDALGDIREKVVIEIGPGKGVLTAMLAERARRVIAIEVDRTLAAGLATNLASRNLEVIQADVLSINFDGLVPGPADVIGNLPYYITSDILLKLFAHHQRFETIVIMVQKEVADRIAASPGSRDYGLLTVTTQLFCDVERLFTLPPEVFSPPPKVHSTVLRLRVSPKDRKLQVDPDRFVQFLKMVFSHKRKTLFNNLKPVFAESATEAIQAAGLRSDVRAEMASIWQLATVFRYLNEKKAGDV